MLALALPGAPRWACGGGALTWDRKGKGAAGEASDHRAAAASPHALRQLPPPVWVQRPGATGLRKERGGERGGAGTASAWLPSPRRPNPRPPAPGGGGSNSTALGMERRRG